MNYTKTTTVRLNNVVRIAEFECVSWFCHRRQLHIGIAKISLRQIYSSICWSFPVKHNYALLYGKSIRKVYGIIRLKIRGSKKSETLTHRTSASVDL